MLKPLLTSTEKWLYAHHILLPARLALPDFLGIGAPQSGTTWLHKNLLKHPGIFLPKKKEVEYFEDNFHRSLRYYARQFCGADGRLKGEITPSYAQMPLSRIQFVGRIMPDVKLIYILRNPVERVWSSVRRHLGQIGRKMEDATEQEIMARIHHPLVCAHTAYSANLDRWLKVFPPEQLCVLFFDDIAAQPKALLTKVFRFLDVSTDIDWDQLQYQDVVNRNPEKPLPPRYREYLENMYRDEINALYKRFGEPVAGWRPQGSDTGAPESAIK